MQEATLGLNSIIRLALFLFLAEGLVMFVIEFFSVAQEHVWQRALWDVSAVALFTVPYLCLWLRRTKKATRSQVSIAAAKSSAIIFCYRRSAYAASGYRAF